MSPTAAVVLCRQRCGLQCWSCNPGNTVNKETVLPHMQSQRLESSNTAWCLHSVAGAVANDKSRPSQCNLRGWGAGRLSWLHFAIDCADIPLAFWPEHRRTLTFFSGRVYIGCKAAITLECNSWNWILTICFNAINMLFVQSLENVASFNIYITLPNKFGLFLFFSSPPDTIPVKYHDHYTWQI